MSLQKRCLSEFLGTAGLLIVVVGSGIMGENLSQGNMAIALLANSLATGAGLFALIQTFGPISGAHFNPAVTFVEFLWKKINRVEMLAYIFAQIVGALFGVALTHVMFNQQVFQLSERSRENFGFLLSEVIATIGLIMVIAFSGKKNVETTPWAVAAFITSAYWCTSSTSFANPAVTIARSFTNTFSGIALHGVPGFILAQAAGVAVSFFVVQVLT
jgi:glycerol uptake facilitator-like aquaporin